MYARAVVASMCKYIHAHTFVPLALLALACPGVCIFVSCFFVLAGLSALPFADFHFLLDWAMATDSSSATCFRFPMNPFPGESSAYIFFFRLLFFLHPPLCIQLLPSTFLFFRIIRYLKPSQLPSSTLFKFAPRHPSPFLYIASHPRFSPPSRIRLLPLPSRGSTIFVDSLSLDSLPTAFAYGFGRLPALLPKQRGAERRF